MTKPSKKALLSLLQKADLRYLADKFDVAVADRRVNASYVEALVKTRAATLDEMLVALPRNTLKEMCRKRGLDDGGRKKVDIADRILGEEPSSKPSQTRLDFSPKKSPPRAAKAKSALAPKRKVPSKLEFKPAPTGHRKKENANVTISAELEKTLWDAADQLWANSGLQPSEYSNPVLALIFLKYADHRFQQVHRQLTEEMGEGNDGGPRRLRRMRGAGLTKDDYLARGVLYVPEEARYQTLLELPEGTDMGKAVNDAMRAIEAENSELKDVLPKTFAKFETVTLASLLKNFGTIPPDADGDLFGRIYEYFLGNFAPRTLQKGGEFFTPVSVVKLIAEVVEPYHGRILDPACGSGGMFVQSANFVSAHQKSPSAEISIHGIEKISQTLRLTKMNLAVHGLAGDIREANTYYEDPHDCAGRFDYVMANPPFNQNAVDKDRIKDDTRRFPFGMPRPDNANFLWIQLFYSALNDTGRAGFVMANSASDAQGSEAEIRQQLIDTGAVDVIITLSSNFFYTVTLPATLWFFDKGKTKTKRKDQILFIDACNTYRQVDRAHRDFTPAQIEYLANIVRLYRGEQPENLQGGGELLEEHFSGGVYVDVPGLCKRATLDKVAEYGGSLNPGRYIEVDASLGSDDAEFSAVFRSLHDQLLELNAESQALEATIDRTALEILEAL